LLELVDPVDALILDSAVVEQMRLPSITSAEKFCCR